LRRHRNPGQDLGQGQRGEHQDREHHRRYFARRDPGCTHQESRYQCARNGNPLTRSG